MRSWCMNLQLRSQSPPCCVSCHAAALKATAFNRSRSFVCMQTSASSGASAAAIMWCIHCKVRDPGEDALQLHAFSHAVSRCSAPLCAPLGCLSTTLELCRQAATRLSNVVWPCSLERCWW